MHVFINSSYDTGLDSTLDYDICQGYKSLCVCVCVLQFKNNKIKFKARMTPQHKNYNTEKQLGAYLVWTRRAYT